MFMGLAVEKYKLLLFSKVLLYTENFGFLRKIKHINRKKKRYNANFDKEHGPTSFIVSIRSTYV